MLCYGERMQERGMHCDSRDSYCLQAPCVMKLFSRIHSEPNCAPWSMCRRRAVCAQIAPGLRNRLPQPYASSWVLLNCAVCYCHFFSAAPLHCSLPCKPRWCIWETLVNSRMGAKFFMSWRSVSRRWRSLLMACCAGTKPVLAQKFCQSQCHILRMRQ